MKLLLLVIISILTMASLQSCSRVVKQNNNLPSTKSEDLIAKITIQKVDDSDKAIMTKTLNQVCEASPSSQTVAWKNSSNDHKGTFCPNKIYKNAQGQDCRKYNYSIEIDGEVVWGRGQACRNYNGIWLEID